MAALAEAKMLQRNSRALSFGLDSPKKLEFPPQEPHVGEGKAEADTSQAGGRLVSLEIYNLTDHLGAQTRWQMEPHFDHIAYLCLLLVLYLSLSFMLRFQRQTRDGGPLDLFVLLPMWPH